MIGLVVVALFLGVLAVLPWFIAKRLEGRASPKLLVSMYLLTLIGLAILPIGWLACVAGGIGDAIDPKATLSITCWINSGGFNIWRISVELFSALFATRLIWVGILLCRATSQIDTRGIAISDANQACMQQNTRVVIVSSSTPVAFATGIFRSRAIISTGLLELLEPPEQRAVIEHELAHIRLGHPRILFIAATISLAYSWLPPVHLALKGLRRELEASADDQASAICGSRPLVLALAKVGIQKGNAAIVSFADADTLRYRIRRLESDKASWATAYVSGLGPVLSLVGMLSLSLCVLFSSIQATNALLGCVSAIGALVLYASRPWQKPKVESPSEA